MLAHHQEIHPHHHLAQGPTHQSMNHQFRNSHGSSSGSSSSNGSSGHRNRRSNHNHMPYVVEHTAEYEQGKTEYARKLKLEVEEAMRRNSALAFINDDLEKRLEREAKIRLDQESRHGKELEAMKQELEAMKAERDAWEARFNHEIKMREVISERLRRTEKELYRMHQRKHEIVNEARRNAESQRTSRQVQESLQEQARRQADEEVLQNLLYPSSQFSAEETLLRRKQMHMVDAASHFFGW